MASYLDSSAKSFISTGLKNLHDTFTQPITFYKNSQRNIVSTSASYNSYYSSPNTVGAIEYEEISQTIMARVYAENASQEMLGYRSVDNFQTNIKLPQGSVKVYVGIEDFAFVLESKKALWDSRTYSVISYGNSVGLFDAKFFEFYLIPFDA